MIQFSADISALTKAQREALAAFIVTFPSQNIEDNEDKETVIIPAFSVEPSPEEAFALAVPTGIAIVPATPGDNLDKQGLPWDERIHAGSRVKTADGCWRKKRGIDDATVAHVEVELKALMSIPPPPVSGAVQPIQAAPVSVPIPAATIVPAAVASTSAEIAAPIVAAVDEKTAFINLISVASAAIGAKTLTQEDLTACCVAAGVPALPLLGNRLDLVPQVAASINAVIASRQ